jgi:hypothetical protein
MPTRLLVMTSGEVKPRLYFTNKGDDELIPALLSQPWVSYIYELAGAESQTPNPFGGVYLKEPKSIVPNSYRDSLLQNYLHQWDGMTKEQVVAEAKKAIEFIHNRRNQHLDSIVQEENDPRTEVIDLTQQEGERNATNRD